MFVVNKEGDKEEKELPCLDRFLAKNTSEDNASFEQIMELAEDKEKLRHSWLYDAEAEYKQVHLPLPPLNSVTSQMLWFVMILECNVVLVGAQY